MQQTRPSIETLSIVLPTRWTAILCRRAWRLSAAYLALLFATGPFNERRFNQVEAADFVVHISVDGLRPDFMQTVINAGNAPNFQRLQEEGAWTNNARTDYSHTNTLPNHTSMLTGRPVSLPSGAPSMTHHGYTSNSTPPPSTTLHNFTNPDYYKASTFDVAHDAGLSTALYASKSKFIIYEQSYSAATGAPHANGRDKIDTFYAPESTASMQNQLLAGLAANHFNYTFVHYADCDDFGHSSGWGSAAWQNALSTVDGYLGELLELIETDSTLADRTAVVLSADHGGSGTGHSTATLAANYTIPFFVWGAGVASGDLYALNSESRVDPGGSRPDYAASDQPIRNGDGGNLALDLLGLGAIPGSLINLSQNLRIALPGDFNTDGRVDTADYVAWRTGLGDKYSMSDYNEWRGHFGQTTANGNGSMSGSPTSRVPEPTTVVHLFVALAFIHRRTRRLGV